MSPTELESNELGSTLLCPIVACEVRIASNEMVALVLQYVETIEEFDSGHWRQLQAVLPAKRALQLAADLEKAATLFLEPHPETLVQ